jgi:hypothetical protein
MRRQSAKKPVRTAKKAANGTTKLDAEEVSFLLEHMQIEERSERAWAAMTSPEAEEDVWGAVEEHLVHQPHEANHKLRRWKFFGK